ncbi:MAG: hypothetical protein P8175_01200 [Deltaproteobacteria bacterium]
MKIKVESEKIVKAVKKLDGIEMVLENAEDAKEALDLILRRTDLFKQDNFARLKDVSVSAIQEYKTSAVDYKIAFLLDFLFEDGTRPETKIDIIKELQAFLNKA